MYIDYMSEIISTGIYPVTNAGNQLEKKSNNL